MVGPVSGRSFRFAAGRAAPLTTPEQPATKRTTASGATKHQRLLARSRPLSVPPLPARCSAFTYWLLLIHREFTFDGAVPAVKHAKNNAGENLGPLAARRRVSSGR
jgi:hypothetical protein